MWKLDATLSENLKNTTLQIPLPQKYRYHDKESQPLYITKWLFQQTSIANLWQLISKEENCLQGQRRRPSRSRERKHKLKHNSPCQLLTLCKPRPKVHCHRQLSLSLNTNKQVHNCPWTSSYLLQWGAQKFGFYRQWIQFRMRTRVHDKQGLQLQMTSISYLSMSW